MKELIAQAVSCKDTNQILSFLKSQSENTSLPSHLQKRFQSLQNTSSDFLPLRTRVINLLQIEEKAVQFTAKNPTNFNDDDDDNLEPIRPKNIDRKAALREINSTIEAYIRNALDQIEQHKIDPKNNNKEANIIAVVHGLNELLENPEHKKYIRLTNTLLLNIIKLQNALNDISLGLAYKPLINLLSLYPGEYVEVGNSVSFKKSILQKLVWFKEKHTRAVREFLTNHQNILFSHIGMHLGISILDAASGDKQLLKRLYAEDASESPLHFAVSWGYAEVASKLLTVAKGNKKLVQMLCTIDVDNRTPLHIAVSHVDTEVASRLLGVAKGNNKLLKRLCRKNENGRSLLHEAAHCDNVKVVVELLKAAKGNEELSEFIYAPDNDGNNPLHLAATYNHERLVEELLRCDGIDVNSKNNEGKTAAELAEPEIKKLIQEHLQAKNDRARLLATTTTLQTQSTTSSTAIPRPPTASSVNSSSVTGRTIILRQPFSGPSL